jgi:hypothetical protein
VKRSWKLSEAKRHQIAQRYAKGESVADLCKEFRVTSDRIYRIAGLRGARRPRREKIASKKKERWASKIARLRAEGRITSYVFPEPNRSS